MSFTNLVLLACFIGGIHTFEWIVNDRDTILSPAGLEKHPTYSEPECGPGCLNSSPGCPKSSFGNPWVYYGDPPRCFLTGLEGPCESGTQILMIQNGSSFGRCEYRLMQAGTGDILPNACGPREEWNSVLNICSVPQKVNSEVGR